MGDTAMGGNEVGGNEVWGKRSAPAPPPIKKAFQEVFYFSP